MNSIRDKLVKIKNQSKLLFLINYYRKLALYSVKSEMMKAKAYKRHLGLKDKRFIKIKALRNKYVGERCFIVATGPSLTIADLEAIKGEYSFSMNSICKLFNQTSWRPTYFGIQDSLVYEKLEQDIQNNVKSPVLVGSNLKKDFKISEEYIEFPFNHYYHEAQKDVNKYFVKFSDDCYEIVYDGYSVTYSLLQIAIYMGFKEIYLLGTDCNYELGKKNHIVDSGYVDPNAYSSYKRLMIGYEELDKYARQHNINIINCTRGGKLELFQRKSLEEVLKREKTNAENY